MKAEKYPKARFCCMECDELLPQGAEKCPYCGAVVAEMNFSLRSNWRGAKLAAKEAAAPKMEKLRQEAERQKLNKRMREDGMRPVAAVIVSQKMKDDTMSRVIAGHMLLGPIGGFVGAAGAKTKVTEVTFSVKYNNGQVKLETVSVNSKRYEELAKLLVQ